MIGTRQKWIKSKTRCSQNLAYKDWCNFKENETLALENDSL